MHYVVKIYSQGFFIGISRFRLFEIGFVILLLIEKSTPVQKYWPGMKQQINLWYLVLDFGSWMKNPPDMPECPSPSNQ